jgi:hypothetical protein
MHKGDNKDNNNNNIRIRIIILHYFIFRVLKGDDSHIAT